MLKCIFICVCLFAVSIANRVDFIKPCRQTDSACIVESAKIAVQHMAPGIEALKLPALDPLVLNDVNADSGELKLSFQNLVVHGLGQCKFNKIERDPVKMTALLDIECPITCVGNYTFGGKMFIQKIYGHGPVEIKGDKMHVIVTIKMKKITKDGVEYYKISGFDYEYEPLTKFTLKFDNLYDGDRAQAEPMEQIMDQSWKDIILEIGRPVLKATVLRICKIVDKLFLQIPTNEIEIV